MTKLPDVPLFLPASASETVPDVNQSVGHVLRDLAETGSYGLELLESILNDEPKTEKK